MMPYLISPLEGGVDLKARFVLVLAMVSTRRAGRPSHLERSDGAPYLEQAEKRSLSTGLERETLQFLARVNFVTQRPSYWN